MIDKMQVSLDMTPSIKDSSFKHIIKALRKYDISLKQNKLVMGPNSQLREGKQIANWT